jgi:3-isopropylmalate dehydrogenase
LKIALLAGDGIGPEIMREAVRVLEVLRGEGESIETEEALVGGAAYDDCGQPLPEKTLKLAQQADAVLFGAVGGPKYDTLARDKRPEKAILGLRSECDFFANLRPATVFPAGRRIFVKARGRLGPRHHDRARAHVRHLFWRAARDFR